MSLGSEKIMAVRLATIDDARWIAPVQVASWRAAIGTTGGYGRPVAGPRDRGDSLGRYEPALEPGAARDTVGLPEGGRVLRTLEVVHLPERSAR